jgi:hypothetical protein
VSDEVLGAYGRDHGEHFFSNETFCGQAMAHTVRWCTADRCKGAQSP